MQPDQQRALDPIFHIETVQRENLNPIETARAYAKLQDQFGLTQREVAVRVGKSRETVANAVRLLNLPSYIQDSVAQNKISESQGRLLLMVSDQKEQRVIFDDLIRNNMSVRELRNRISFRKPEIGASIESLSVDPETEHLEEQLREALGTKVKLQKEGDSGKLTINFYSQEELQNLIAKLVQSSQTQESESSNPDEGFSV